MDLTAIVSHPRNDHQERPGQYGALTPTPLPARERGLMHTRHGDRLEVGNRCGR